MFNNQPLVQFFGKLGGLNPPLAAGVREILECFFAAKPIRDEYLIVHEGRLAGAGAIGRSGFKQLTKEFKQQWL